jgi:hypothetical protein
MATHDYVIANGTGAAVRSDLNNALAAIVSNNSGTSEPATTYAYQWWADTTANVLKIRNSANNAWITLRELDGTMLIEDGSASSPGLAFADDTNTGIFSPAADNIALTTGGGERFRVNNSEAVFNEDSNSYDFRVETNALTHALFVDGSGDAVGIGNSAPGFRLAVQTTAGATSAEFTDASNSTLRIAHPSSGVARIGVNNNQHLVFGTNFGENVRLNSNGKFLIGASSPRENFYSTTGQTWQHQIEGTSYITSGQLQVNNSNNALGAYFNLAKSRGTSVGSNVIVQDGDTLGNLEFHGNDGTDFVHAARISAQVDGTPGSNDMPARLTFHTTADGATSPTERMRLDSSGRLLLGLVTNNANSNSDNLVIGSTSDTHSGITINGSTSSQIRFADAASNSVGYIFYNHGSNKMEFATGGTERMIITQYGFVQAGGYVNQGAQYHRFNGVNQNQGSAITVISGFQSSGGSSGDTAVFYAVNTGASFSGSNTAMGLYRDTGTSRSLSASGTLNASGADYAEYMTKAGNFTLAKGDICGINSEGKLTNVFADAITFVVKSTDPSYVGGDTWHTAAGEKPGGYDDDRTEEEIAAATVVYEEALEAARQLVDRIAFSGQVPVNVTGATPGQHIIPTAAADGSIKGTAKAEADLTMAEYMSSVGKVIAIGDDGRARIIVKVA